jgi:hypothetical protein
MELTQWRAQSPADTVVVNILIVRRGTVILFLVEILHKNANFADNFVVYANYCRCVTPHPAQGVTRGQPKA